MSKNENAISRRDFLKRATVGAAGLTTLGVLGACTNTTTPASSSSLDPTATSPAGSALGGTHMDSGLYGQKWSFEIPPDPITNTAETIEADVVVVGAGTAGLITAVSALEQGLKVILVSASSIPISRGGSNNAAYSKVMEKAGFSRYSPEMIRKEIAMNYNSVDQKKWYNHYNNSERCMNWLIDIMAEAGYDCAVEENAQIAEDDLYYTAHAAHGFINAENQSVGMTQPFVVNALAARLEENGGKIYYKNIGRQLVRGDTPNGTSGRVTAVICEREDGSCAQYVGKKAVVLATGDFSADREMMTKYCSWLAKYVPDDIYDSEIDYDKEFAINGLYRGDGHKMGLWVGAAWQRTYPNAPMGGTPGAPGPSPIIYDTFWGLVLDRDGERFMNEYASSKMAGRTYWLQAGEKAYGIWDKDYIKVSDKWLPSQGGYGIIQSLTPEEVYSRWDASVETGMYVKGDTVEEVIEKLGLPKETALASIARYNEMCTAGQDTDFYKRSDVLIPIQNGPFYGATNNPVDILCILGGLRTNARMQVCDADDNPIPGLYNVGTMIGDFYAGLYTFQMEGVNYGATCITFGKMLGEYIAQNE